MGKAADVADFLRLDPISLDVYKRQVQHRILYLLSKPGELFMVGDEDQSIYGFRAAYPDIFLRFAEIYPGAALLRLETNYRSSSVITSAAERFIRRNKRRNEKQMRAARPEGAAIRVTEFLHKRAQYAYLVRQLAALPPGQTAAVLYRNNESVLPLLELSLIHIYRMTKSRFSSTLSTPAALR